MPVDLQTTGKPNSAIESRKTQRFYSFAFFLLFCLLTGSLAFYYLHVSLEKDEEKVRQKVLNTSHLIGEWIAGAFVASDYILRDIVYTVPVSQLQFPAADSEAHARITRFIDDKRRTLPHANGVGLNDADCVVTHTLSVVGFDASHREWCSVPKNNPEIETYVSNMFVSNNGEMMVIQARRFPGANFVGLAGIGVNLDFFSRWLEKVSVDPHGVIAILDNNLSLLARKPSLPSTLGKSINTEIVQDFLASEKSYATFETHSPLDGESRIYAVRKIMNLPFTVIVGEADIDWQAEWTQRLWATIAVVAILWLMALVTLRTYWARLNNLAELNAAREKLEKLTVHDPLTGLANRRLFDTAINAEFRRLRRARSPLSVMMIDVDFFKTFNDTYGHPAGDECLRTIANAIQNNLKRPQDLAARYGGEEFTCILPETDHEAAIQIASKMKDSIANLAIQYSGSRISEHVTVSIGVATSRCDENITPEQLVNLADQCLYRAKKNGRNRVESEERKHLE